MEFDELKFGKRKYNCGRAVDGHKQVTPFDSYYLSLHLYVYLTFFCLLCAIFVLCLLAIN